MLLIRITAFLVLAAIAVSLAFYLFTKDARYLRFAWQTFRLAAVLAMPSRCFTCWSGSF